MKKRVLRLRSNSDTKTNDRNSLNLLKIKALELGAIEAKIIPTESIVIENRVVLKCRLGCEKYGKTLTCPPHAPSPQEFRNIVSEYQNALFMKFKSRAEGDAELIKYLSKTNKNDVSADMKIKIEKFWSAWNDDAKKILMTVLELEKVAAKKGFILATGFVPGACQLCKKCNVENKKCVHPQMRRYSEEGLGVNVKATAEKAGFKFILPFEKNPESYALLLID